MEGRVPSHWTSFKTSPTKGQHVFFFFPDCKVCHLVVLFWNSSHVTISKHRWIPSGFPCLFFKRLVENMRFHRTANFLGSSFSEANLWSLRGFIVVFLLHLPSTQDASSWQIKANTDSRSLKCNVILLMEEILHQLIWQIISHYLQCKVLLHSRWCRISSINSIILSCWWASILGFV